MSLKKILKFIKLRAKEPSTYVGLATIATVAGLPKVAETIGQVGTAAVLVLGGGLVAASQHPSDSDRPFDPG
jgi:hypothetical protein